MCLIIFAHRSHVDYPFLLAANRDEFFSRPTQFADFWSHDDQSRTILAGKDLTLGGTWLGVSPAGRIAAVTNIRNPERVPLAQKSRGFLVRDYLLGTQSIEHYLKEIAASQDLFSGFNLLLGDRESLYYFNNLDGEVEKLAAGVYGLSNGALDANWPKINLGKSQLSRLIESGKPIAIQHLIDIMTDTEIAPDHQLPATGVAIELERLLSASFIKNTERDYGTRCSTAMIIDSHDTVRFYEQNYLADATVSSRKLFTFPILVD